MTDAFIEPSKREALRKWAAEEEYIHRHDRYPNRDKINVPALLNHAAEAERRIAAQAEEIEQMKWAHEYAAEVIELRERVAAQAQRIEELEALIREVDGNWVKEVERLAVLTSERDKTREAFDALTTVWQHSACLGCDRCAAAFKTFMAYQKDAACPATEPTPSKPVTGGTEIREHYPCDYCKKMGRTEAKS